MNSKMIGQLVGVLLVLVAIILVAVQHFGGYNLYGDASNKWYFYGLVGIVGLLGIVLVAWYLMKKK